MTKKLFIKQLIFGMMFFTAGCIPLLPLEPTPIPTMTPTPFQVAPATLTPAQSPEPTATITATAIPATPTLEEQAVAIPIIEYHNPSFELTPEVQMQPAWFAEQLQWLADEGYTTLSADDLVAFVNGERSFPQKSVVLTFDLGTAQYQDYAENVIPLLRQHGFRAVFFILVNNSVIRDDCSHPQNVFCWGDLQAWVDEGLISIGSHGLTHPDYAKQSADAIRQDMVGSKQILEERLGVTVQILAYPYDSAPTIAQQILLESGFILGINGNTRPEIGAMVDDPQRYYLPRLYPYSSPGVYPLLYAYKRTFADVVTDAGQ
ncbi:MAG: polysaccharide deacetylase family protein [Anaerolineaceae bacterium]